jgi:hypothetical protein
MKPFKIRKVAREVYPYDVYDVIELYKAKIIDLNEARYLSAECMNSWYKAALRRKKIAEAKTLKAARYVDEMNKRANDKSTAPNTR